MVGGALSGTMLSVLDVPTGHVALARTTRSWTGCEIPLRSKLEGLEETAVQLVPPLVLISQVCPLELLDTREYDVVAPGQTDSGPDKVPDGEGSMVMLLVVLKAQLPADTV